jgi:hypothetical protein
MRVQRVMEVEINNYPEYADKYNYIVAREVEGEYWFYGAYDRLKADAVAREVDGKVFRNY